MSRYRAPSSLVIDASAVVELLLQTPRGIGVERAVGDAELVAPDIVNPEVAQSLRGLQRGGRLTEARASKAISRLAQIPLSPVP
jgi:predicted nucleic acid-binding protein